MPGSFVADARRRLAAWPNKHNVHTTVITIFYMAIISFAVLIGHYKYSRSTRPFFASWLHVVQHDRVTLLWTMLMIEWYESHKPKTQSTRWCKQLQRMLCTRLQQSVLEWQSWHRCHLTRMWWWSDRSVRSTRSATWWMLHLTEHRRHIE